jgi:hypothetical protein
VRGPSNGSFAIGIAATVALLWGCGGGGGGSTTTPPPPAEIITITSNPVITCVQTLPFSQTLQDTGATGTVTWSVSSGALPAGLTLDGTTGTISGTPTTAASNTIATIRVSDGKSAGSLQFGFDVFLRLSITPVTPGAAHANVPYSLEMVPQGGGVIAGWSVVSGQLPTGLSLTENQSNGNGEIGGVPTQAGTYGFTVQVSDTVPQTATMNLTIVVDTRLVITKGQVKGGEQGQAYSDSFTAVNGTAPLTWSISGALATGLTLDGSTGQVSGTPTAAGQFIYTVTVKDSSATPQKATAPQGLQNIAPPLQIVGSLEPAYINTSYGTILTATGGFYPYTWSIVSGSLPPGLTLAGAQIVGKPTQLGSSTFVLQVADSAVPPATMTQTETLNVTPTPVNVLGNPLSPAPVNVVYHSQIPISGGTPPYGFAITSGNLPPGLTFDPTTGFIDGTPTQVGTYNFTASGTDSSQPVQTGTANDFIQIQKGLGRNDSIATATPLGNSQNVNIPVVLSISPYIDPINAMTPNPDTDYYRLVANAGSTVHVQTNAQSSWLGNPLDSVIELLDGNGTRLSSCGKPAYTSSCLNDNIDATTLDSALDYRVPGTAGTQKTFYVHVLDWRGDARPDMQYYLDVSGVVEPLKITTQLGAGATRGVSYNQQMTSTGGTGGTITWAVDSGTLPTGWALSSTGMLSGTATADGTYTFTIRAADAGTPPQVAKAQYTLLITEPVAITSPATMPTACVNKPYSFTVKTTGGIPPIQFSFFSVAWLSVNLDQNTGVFSGTPGVTGTFTGSLGAVDSAQPISLAGQTVTLTVVTCP